MSTIDQRRGANGSGTTGAVPSEGNWMFPLFANANTWIWTSAHIGLCAAAIARYHSWRGRIESQFPDLKVSSSGALPSVIVLLVLAIIIWCITTWILIYLFTHKPEDRSSPVRGFNGFPSFYWTFGTLMMVLAWLEFGAIVAYTYFFRNNYLNIFGRVGATRVIIVGDPRLAEALGYINWPLLRAVDGFGWIVWGSAILSALSLLCGASSAAERIPEPRAFTERKPPTSAAGPEITVGRSGGAVASEGLPTRALDTSNEAPLAESDPGVPAMPVASNDRQPHPEGAATIV